jgi:hypothetical protein
VARRTTGQVCPPNDGRGWAIRFRAYGKRRYVTLGHTEDGWNRERAEAELRHVLADVERGTWHPYELEPVEARAEIPTFHEFASEWLANREPELRPKTVASYRWQLVGHLLPFFARMRVAAISAEDVDRYKAAKLREGVIGAKQINKTLGLLAQILDAAADYGHLDPARNPARGSRRRVKRTRPHRPTIEPEQLPSLLDAAGGGRSPGRRPGGAAPGAGRAQGAEPQGRGSGVPKPQRRQADPEQRREAAQDRDPASEPSAAPARHRADQRGRHAALAPAPVREPAIRARRRSGLRRPPARPHRAGLLDEGLR